MLPVRLLTGFASRSSMPLAFRTAGSELQEKLNLSHNQNVHYKNNGVIILTYCNNLLFASYLANLHSPMYVELELRQPSFSPNMFFCSCAF
jgi:hypothetical protein